MRRRSRDFRALTNNNRTTRDTAINTATVIRWYDTCARDRIQSTRGPDGYQRDVRERRVLDRWRNARRQWLCWFQ